MAGGFAAERHAGRRYIDRYYEGAGAEYQLHGAQQQLRAVSRLQPTEEAERRLVEIRYFVALF